MQACTPRDTQESEFVITGRGGLPPSASEAIGTDAIGIDVLERPKLKLPKSLLRQKNQFLG